MRFIQKNLMLLLGIIVGGIVFVGSVYAATVAASSVSYDNSSSKLSSTNVQGAIDGLYTDVDTMKGAYYRTQCISSSSISYKISNSYGAITVYLN